MADVLVVDDHPANRDLIATLLRYRGHTVTEAEDGVAGLALARSARRDLVITDVMMPGLDGYEMVRELRADPATAATTVVFYTAHYLRDEVRPLAAACGVHHLILKPSDPEEMLAVIDAALAGDAPRPAVVPTGDFDREHLRALSAKLVEKVRELEATQAALVESEGRFRRMTESLPIGVVVADAAGVWTYANRRFAEICGLDDADRLSRSYQDLVHPDDLPHVAAIVQAAQAEGRAGEFRARVVRPDGEVRWVNVQFQPVPTGGASRGYVATVQDVTALVMARQQQEALDARLRVSERLESLGQLAGGVAHDFNNLLAVIVNYAGFVSEALAGDDPATIDLPQIRDDVAEIRQAAERGARLTHQLLIFGRREVVHPEVIDPAAAVGDLEELLRRTIGEHVTIDIRVAEAVRPVRVDPSRFDQVLLNLVVNARDAIRAVGTVVVDVDNIEVDEATAAQHGVAAGHFVRVAVSDTGSGMTPEVAARAFEPFFTTKELGHGTGLGLATVYGIVRDWGGSVAIDSVPGHGTTVRLYVPAADPGAGALHAPGAPSPPVTRARGELVLVVEDDPAVRATTCRIVEEGGYRVVSAASGHAALELLEALDPPPTLLLTDVVMPQMSGRQLAEQAARRWPTMGVVFMSGYTQDLMLDHEALPTEVPLVEKPFTRESLLSAMGAAVAERAP